MYEPIYNDGGDTIYLCDQLAITKEEYDQDIKLALGKAMEKLKKRELQILKLIAEGLFNKEIGDRLDISERTVKNHVFNLFKKIDAADRTQAAVFAIRNNVVEIK